MSEPSSPVRVRRRRLRAHQPTRARRRRSTLAVAAVIVLAQVALAVALAVGLDATSLWAAVTTADTEHSRVRPMGVGDCVRATPGRTAYYVGADCADASATGRVLAVRTGPGAGTEACPEESDFFATRPTQVICLRKLGGEHPGDAGAGGGVYRRGDCVALERPAGLREVPCAGPTVFETVVDRVRKATECRVPAIRFALINHGDRRVLCLGDGPGLATTGECIGDLASEPLTFDAIECGDEAARARVLARVGAASACASVSGTSRTVTDRSGLPGGAVVCLRTLRRDRPATG